MDGWIKMYRKTLDNPIITKDAEYFAVWIYLLLKATHVDLPSLFKGKKIILKPGQLLTGRNSISTFLNISESKVTRILNMLESEHQIEQQTSNKNRIITIVNWDMYQGYEQQCEQQLNNNRTTTEQQLNTNKNIKNIKNIKNSNKYNVCFEEFWKVYPRRIDKGKASKCYQARVNDGWREEELLTAAKNYAEYCEQNHTDTRYIKHPSTFLSASTPFTDYLKKGVTDGATGVGRYSESDEEYAERMAELDRRIAAGEFDQDEDEHLF